MTTERTCSSCGGAIGPAGHLCMGGRDLTGVVRAIRWNCAKCGQSGEGLGADHDCPAIAVGSPEWEIMKAMHLEKLRQALAPPCHICGQRPGTKPIVAETPAGLARAMICSPCELDLVRGGPWLPCRAN